MGVSTKIQLIEGVVCVSKLLVMLEPTGYYELDVAHMVDPESEYVAYIMVSGDGDIPVVECSEIDLSVYQAHGHEVRNVEELDNLRSEHGIYVEVNIAEWTKAAIGWYEQRGFTAEHINSYVMVSALE